MRKRSAIVAIAAITFGAVVVAQLSSGDRAAIERYRAAIGSAQSGRPPGGVEAAFSALTSVREALMRLQEGGQTVVESLSKEEFGRLERQLPGVLMFREEGIFVGPDPDYFATLAATHGDDSDRRFFAAFKTTFPGGVWPVYVEQQTDYSGCTRFGSMSLVDTYRAWTDFRTRFPRRYAAAAEEEVNQVLEQLTQSTCACGDMNGVERELEAFVRAFPASPARPQIEQRLEAVRGGRSKIRVKCVSG